MGLFSGPFDLFELCPLLFSFCVHIVSAKTFTKFGIIPMKSTKGLIMG